MRLKDKVIFSVEIGDWRRWENSWTQEIWERRETSWKRRDMWRKKRWWKNEERELLICFTPTPPPQLHGNRGSYSLFCLTGGSPGSYAPWEWKISPFCILRLGCAALRCHWYLSNICLYWIFFSVAFVDRA